MALYTFGFSTGFPVVFGTTTPPAPPPFLPASLNDEPGIIRFANKRQREMTNQFADNSAEAARINGTVLILQQPAGGSSRSGIVTSTAGRYFIYGKTSKAVLATERRNLDAFGNVIFP